MNEKTRSACRFGLGALAVFVLTFGYLFVQVFNLTGDVDDNGDSAREALAVASQAREQTGQLKESVEEANRRLRAAGKPTVPVPTLTALPPVPQPLDGLTAAEAASVRAIVVDQLARQKVTLTPEQISQITRAAAALIPKPKDGTTPTNAQLQPLVVSAVAAYCTADRCVRPGKDGSDGKDGTDAPPITDEQLFAQAQRALMAYCALDSQPCKPKDGVDGKDGTDGEDGTNGVSVEDTDCVGEGAESYWRIHYSDGTTGTSSGPCRIALPTTTTPEPTTTPAPTSAPPT